MPCRTLSGGNYAFKPLDQLNPSGLGITIMLYHQPVVVGRDVCCFLPSEISSCDKSFYKSLGHRSRLSWGIRHRSLLFLICSAVLGLSYRPIVQTDGDEPHKCRAN